MDGLIPVFASVNHPRLAKTDTVSVLLLLSDSDYYVIDLHERARKLIIKSFVSIEPIRPVNLKYCVDTEWLESLLELRLIEGFNNYDSLTEYVLWDYLDSNSEKSKDAFNLDGLKNIVKQAL